jgi:hypothetical protein
MSHVKILRLRKYNTYVYEEPYIFVDKFNWNVSIYQTTRRQVF